MWLIFLIFASVAAFSRQVAAQTTPYPGPRPTPTLAAGAAYPGGQPTAVSQPATAYPVNNLPVSEPTNTPIPRVGSNPQPTLAANPGDNTSDSSPNTDLRNDVILWAGFFLSLLIFVAAVYATIMLYTRKQA